MAAFNSEPAERSWIFTALLTVCTIAVVGTAFAAVAYFLTANTDGSQAHVAGQQVKGALTTACNAYKLHNGDWPSDLRTLLEKGERGGPYLDGPDALRDPWGNAYQYDFHGPENDGVKPDIWAVHPTTGAKVGNWTLR